MPVTGSSFTISPTREVVETHTCTGRVPYVFRWTAPEGLDVTPLLAERAAMLNDVLAQREAEDNFARDGAPTLVEMTAAQFASRLRERFRDASRDDQCRLCYWIIRRIASGDVTDTQLRNAFGLNTTQWNTLKANKIQPRADAWTAVLAAVGE